MIYKLTKVFFLVASVCLIAGGCKDQWDDHNRLTDGQLGKTLFQVIEEHPQLSAFKELLVKTGYDKLIASSTKFTIWAPDNTALQTLDALVAADSIKLRQFVGNHIVSQVYYTKTAGTGLRIKTVNGKYIRFYTDEVEGVPITKSNITVGNGVLHQVSGLIYPKYNILEYLNGTSFVQKDAVNALEYEAIDSSKAEQIGIDPVTGMPVYKPGTGIIKKNYLFDKTGDLADEDQEYTVIVLDDNAFNAELTKFSPYTEGDHHAIDNAYTVLKDLVFKGLIDIDTVTNNKLVSADGVNVPFQRSELIEKIATSNGYIYRMRATEVSIGDKILPVKREGELPDGFSRADKSANITYRLRRVPADTINHIPSYLFNDIYIFNHKVPLFHVKYDLHHVYKGRYKIYWVAPNDVQTVTFKQRIAFNDFNGSYLEKTVPLKNFQEVEVGEYVVEKYGDLSVYIIADDNGTDQTNSINLDYFKLVPQLP